MTGTELAAYLRSLATVLDLHGERRINGLTLDVCDGIELVVPTAAAERQRKSRRKPGGPPPDDPGGGRERRDENVASSVTPDAQKRGLKRNENMAETVTDDEPEAGSVAPPLHSPSGSDPGFSEISPSSSASGSREDEEDDGVTERVTDTPHASVTPGVTFEARIMCPIDLELLSAQRGGLELVSKFHIHAITVEYRTKYAGDETQLRTLGQWRRGLVTAILRAWNNPSERRKPPADDEPTRLAPPVADHTRRPIEMGPPVTLVPRPQRKAAEERPSSPPEAADA